MVVCGTENIKWIKKHLYVYLFLLITPLLEMHIWMFLFLLWALTKVHLIFKKINLAEMCHQIEWSLLIVDRFKSKSITQKLILTVGHAEMISFAR